MTKAGWTVFALLLSMPLFSLFIGNAEGQTRSELNQLKQELQMLRDEVQTKNNVIKRMQERLEALETKIQAEVPRPVEEKMTALKEEMKTELAAKAETSRLSGGQVFFKGGFVRMEDPRRNSLLTRQDDPTSQNGWQVGGGVDLPIMTIFNSTLLGEIYVEYIQTQKTTGNSDAEVKHKVVFDGQTRVFQSSRRVFKS